MGCEIWEMSSGNMAGSFTNAEKALAIVDAFVQREGPRAADTFALIEIGPRGKRKTLASGARLVKMAAEHAAAMHETHMHTTVDVSKLPGPALARQVGTLRPGRLHQPKNGPKSSLVARKRRVLRLH